MNAIRLTILLTAALNVGCAVFPPEGDPAAEDIHVFYPPRGRLLVFRADEAPDWVKKSPLSPELVNKNTGGNGYYHVAYSLGNGWMIHGLGACPD